MIRGWVSGSQGCYRLTRGKWNGSPPNSVNGLPHPQVLGFPLEYIKFPCHHSLSKNAFKLVRNGPVYTRRETPRVIKSKNRKPSS